jgi:hypothetical protein
MWKGDVGRARALVEESQAIHERNDNRWQRIFGVAQTIDGAVRMILRSLALSGAFRPPGHLSRTDWRYPR